MEWGAGETQSRKVRLETKAEATSQGPLGSHGEGSGKESCHPVCISESLLWLLWGGPEKDVLKEGRSLEAASGIRARGNST